MQTISIFIFRQVPYHIRTQSEAYIQVEITRNLWYTPYTQAIVQSIQIVVIFPDQWCGFATVNFGFISKYLCPRIQVEIGDIIKHVRLNKTTFYVESVFDA